MIFFTKKETENYWVCAHTYCVLTDGLSDNSIHFSETAQDDAAETPNLSPQPRVEHQVDIMKKKHFCDLCSKAFNSRYTHLLLGRSA